MKNIRVISDSMQCDIRNTIMNRSTFLSVSAKSDPNVTLKT